MLALAAAPAAAKSFAITEAHVTIALQPDGSLLVTERLDFAFSEMFQGAYRDIPLRRGETITDVVVSENEMDYRLGAPTALGSTGDPSSYGVEDRGNLVRVVWHYRASDEVRTFVIRYRVTGVTVAYDDVVDVNWKVWGDHWDLSAGRVDAHLDYPGLVESSEVYVFGHPGTVDGSTTLGEVVARKARQRSSSTTTATPVSPSSTAAPVQGRDGAVVTAVVADIDFGDVDGDGLAEVVMGGLAEFQTGCDNYDAFVTVRDDALNGFAAVDTDTFNAFFSNCPAFGPWRLRFLHVGALDLDGDGVDEVHANLRVYANLSESDELTLDFELPQDVFVDRDSDAGARISSATTSMTTGDVTGDGRENLIVYAQWQGDVGIWGLSAVASVGFAELSSLDVTTRFNTQNRVEPIILTVNADADSPLLKYSDGEYALAFTEPVVIAAMAAAPCGQDIGQNIDACATAFGQGESTTVDASLTVTVKAGVHAGVQSEAKIPIVGGVSASLKESVTLTASVSAGTAYTVEKSRTFTTGSLEDGVVFTTIPYDRYTYTILSHPDPTLVGGTIVVSLPREPIILKVDREFYNASITESSIQIGGQVFDHAVGDLSSYPNLTRKNELLRQLGGLENGPISVGQGNGSSGLEIAVSTEVSLGGSLGLEYEREVETTAGPAMVGYTVGYGVEASLTVTSGSQMTYSVEVGDLDGANFAANQYSYGIFTYVQTVGDQKFEVINFWVE